MNKPVKIACLLGTSFLLLLVLGAIIVARAIDPGKKNTTEVPMEIYNKLPLSFGI